MSDKKKSESKPGPSSAERPHATLDLKAERMDEASAEASGAAPETGPSEERAGGDGPPTPREGGTATRFLTHLAAGLLGGLIALVAGYYALGSFRDRLPFVAETSAEQLRASQQQLEQRIAALAERSQQAQAELADRIAALDARTEGLARTDDAAVQDLTARVESLQQQVEQSAAAEDPGRAEEIAALDQRLAGLNERVASLNTELEEVRTQTAENVAAARAAALAVGLSNLRRAVESGRPYAAELKAVRELAPQPLEADALAAAASDGVPTLRQLQESFPQFANAALEAAGENGDDSIIGQIMESARQVVDVRPVGEIEGDSPSAIIARIENRVKAGDLAGVMEQAQQLSGEPAAQLTPWLERVQTRLNASQEIETLEARMLAAAGQ